MTESERDEAIRRLQDWEYLTDGWIPTDKIHEGERCFRSDLAGAKAMFQWSVDRAIEALRQVECERV